MNENRKSFTRREFVSQSGRSALALGAGLTSTRAWASVLGANDRIRLGIIGPGGRGRHLMKAAQVIPGVEITAVCDVYEPNRQKAIQLAGGKAQSFVDYRRLLDSKEIDGVLIATPDHWHAFLIIDSVHAGKDVYCEKPMTHSLEEGAKIIQAVKGTQQVVQIGMQQRSWDHFIRAKEIVASGKLGKITLVNTWWYQNSWGARLSRRGRPQELEGKLDWEQWLGPAPKRSFEYGRFRNWRRYWDYGGGGLTDLLTHLIDVVQWYMGVEAPLTAMASGGIYQLKDWECPDTIAATYEYPGNFSVNYSSTYITGHDDHGITLRGTLATLVINRTQLAVYEEGTRKLPPPLIPREVLPSGEKPVMVVKSIQDGTYPHMRNFIDCIQSRKEPDAPPTLGHQAVIGPHLGNISYREGRKVNWDAGRAQ